MIKNIIEKSVIPQGKETTFAAALILLLCISTFFAGIGSVNAHMPTWQVPTYSYVSAVPSPVGQNQLVTIVFWLDKPPPTSSGVGGDRWQKLTVTLTKPDGTKQTLGPFTSDPVGGTYTLYTPDQTGTYTAVFNFPGQVLSLNGPTGIPGGASDFINDTYLPSSATTTFIVQKDPIPLPVEYALPTGFWTRPIEGENTNWDAVASNWLAGPQIIGKVQPQGIAPNSPHIMWTKPISFGGVVGGSYSNGAGMTIYDGSQYENKFMNPIIMYGRLYYALPQSDASTGNGYVCVDLITGEQIYWQNMTQPTFGQFYDYESMNQHGIIPNGYLWRSVSDTRNGGTVWMAYDPMDGNWLFNETNVPSGTQVYGPNGEILIFQMNYPGRWLAMWNNTAAPTLAGALGTGSSAYQWRPIGKNANASTAYTWNVTIPDLTGIGNPSISKVVFNDFMLGMSTSMGGLSSFGTPNPYTVWAVSLKPATRGQLMWIKNYSAPAGNLTRSLAQVDPISRVFVMFDKEKTQWTGFNVDTGNQIWGPTASENPFNFYSGGGGALMTNTVAYGKFYTTGYSGIVNCYDLSNGKLLWNSTVSSGFATPYGGYPLGIAGVADGKLYVSTNEHSSGAPYWKGAKLRCLDANTGAEIWNMLAHGCSNYGAYGYAIADGYFVFLNVYDMQIYCIGKGPSASTVTAPQTAVPRGNTVLITGSVTDQTPNSKGTPAISDKDMGAWMEYLHMQKPIPTNAKGVTVSVTAIDPNGNFQNIGNTTSDIGGNFGIAWNPPVEGMYQLKATFSGSASYGDSYATAYMFIGPQTTAASPKPTETAPIVTPAPTAAPTISPAPSTTTAPQPTSGAPTTTFVAIGSAVIIIVIAAAALVLRRRK
jgi:hypothetical protein